MATAQINSTRELIPGTLLKLVRSHFGHDSTRKTSSHVVDGTRIPSGEILMFIQFSPMGRSPAWPVTCLCPDGRIREFFWLKIDFDYVIIQASP